MSIEKVRAYFRPLGLEERIRELEASSATVELAALALGVDGARIAKTLSFLVGDRCILIVTAGDARIDNHKYKARFGVKAKMPAHDEVPEYTGHAVGGVCPFACKEGVSVYLDESLKRFRTVFPACGSANSAIELTIPELEQKVRAQLENRQDANRWMEVIRRYTEITALDESILFELVDRIEVGEARKVNGQRICDVKVVYRYVGSVDDALAQERLEAYEKAI